MRYQFLWDVILGHRVFGSRLFKTAQWSVLQTPIDEASHRGRTDTSGASGSSSSSNSMLNQSTTKLNLPPFIMSHVQEVATLNTYSIVRIFLNDDHLSDEEADAT
jgi:hypothetical protein